MRYCHNEEPRVYEAVGDDLPELFEQVADQVRELGDEVSAVQVNSEPSVGTGHLWLVTLVAF